MAGRSSWGTGFCDQRAGRADLHRQIQRHNPVECHEQLLRRHAAGRARRQPRFQGEDRAASPTACRGKGPRPALGARKKLYDALIEIDKQKYTLRFDGHLQGHFEIVGFCNTPASDGRYVYFWNGAGVAACYDLEGNRRWIRRLDAKKLFYSAAPAVIGGKLAVYFTKMYGLDAKSGRIAWEQPEVSKTVASLLSARIAGVDVFISQQGEVVRAADGKMLWKNPTRSPTTRAGPADRDGQRDVSALVRHPADIRPRFRRLCGRRVEAEGRHRRSSARGFPLAAAGTSVGIPRNQTAGSPLIYQGRAYINDFCGGYYVVDSEGEEDCWPARSSLERRRRLLCRHAGSGELHARGQARGGDGQPGTYSGAGAGRPVQRGRPQPDRHTGPARWATTTQEYTAYAPPVADGKRMYIRGERHLYCIGSE